MGMAAGITLTLSIATALKARSIPDNVLNPDIGGIRRKPIGDGVTFGVVCDTTPQRGNENIHGPTITMNGAAATTPYGSTVVDLDTIAGHCRIDIIAEVRLNKATKAHGAGLGSSRTLSARTLMWHRSRGTYMGWGLPSLVACTAALLVTDGIGGG